MVVETRDQMGVAVVAPAGRLDARSAGAVRQHLRTLAECGKCAIVVDMRRVEFVDSAGLAALVSGLKLARSYQGDLRLASLQDPVRMVLEITRLHRAFHVYEDADDAVAAFVREAIPKAVSKPQAVGV